MLSNAFFNLVYNFLLFLTFLTFLFNFFVLQLIFSTYLIFNFSQLKCIYAVLQYMIELKQHISTVQNMENCFIIFAEIFRKEVWRYCRIFSNIQSTQRVHLEYSSINYTYIPFLVYLLPLDKISLCLNESISCYIALYISLSLQRKRYVHVLFLFLLVYVLCMIACVLPTKWLILTI